MRVILAASILLACAVLTYRRAEVWTSKEWLWTEAVQVSPESPRPHLNLALEYQHDQKMDLAMTEEMRALELTTDPNRMQRHQRMSKADAQSNIALLLLLKGQFAASEQLSSEVLRDWPDFPSALINRGTARLALDRCPEAIQDYVAAGIKELPRCLR